MTIEAINRKQRKVPRRRIVTAVLFGPSRELVDFLNALVRIHLPPSFPESNIAHFMRLDIVYIWAGCATRTLRRPRGLCHCFR